MEGYALHHTAIKHLNLNLNLISFESFSVDNIKFEHFMNKKSLLKALTKTTNT